MVSHDEKSLIWFRWRSCSCCIGFAKLSFDVLDVVQHLSVFHQVVLQKWWWLELGIHLVQLLDGHPMAVHEATLEIRVLLICRFPFSFVAFVEYLHVLFGYVLVVLLSLLPPEPVEAHLSGWIHTIGAQTLRPISNGQSLFKFWFVEITLILCRVISRYLLVHPRRIHRLRVKFMK